MEVNFPKAEKLKLPVSSGPGPDSHRINSAVEQQASSHSAYSESSGGARTPPLHWRMAENPGDHL